MLAWKRHKHRLNLLLLVYIYLVWWKFTECVGGVYPTIISNYRGFLIQCLPYSKGFFFNFSLNNSCNNIYIKEGT